MARAQKTTKAPQGLSDQVSRALREGALYVFGALALILWYALFTYDLNDPSFSQATSTSQVNNGVGRVGAVGRFGGLCGTGVRGCRVGRIVSGDQHDDDDGHEHRGSDPEGSPHALLGGVGLGGGHPGRGGVCSLTVSLFGTHERER